MAVNTYNLDIYQGSTFDARLYVKDSSDNYVNLQGYTGRGYVRNNYSSTGVLLDLNPTIYTVNYTSGIIDISINATGTAALPVTKAVYDIEVVSGNYVSKVIKGRVIINPEVTH